MKKVELTVSLTRTFHIDMADEAYERVIAGDDKPIEGYIDDVIFADNTDVYDAYTETDYSIYNLETGETVVDWNLD